MKRITALLMCFMLSFQLFSADVSAEKHDSESSKNLLVSLGIIQKYDYENEDEITRSDFSDLIVKTLNKQDIANSVVTNGFSDVGEEDENAAEIYYLNSLGIMVGDGFGKFHPYNGLLVQEAIKSVVTMLNYGGMAKLEGGYPSGYMKIAGELGLTKGLNKSTADKLTAEDAYILLANALRTPVLQAVQEDGKIVYKHIEEETLMYEAFNCIMGEGIVSANDRTTLLTEKTGPEGSVVIGGNSLYSGNTDISSKLGYYVEYYAIDNKKDDPVIIAYEIPENKNDILIVSAQNILDTTTTNKIDFEVSNKTKSAEIAAGADIVYNGVAKQDVKKWYFTPDSGSVTLFDTDNDKKYDIVVVESYINYVLDKTPQGGYITDKYVYGSINTEDEDLESVAVYFKGKEIKLSELKEWDVLSVKADAEKTDAKGFREIDFGKAKYLEIYVSRNEISGRADRVNMSEKTVTIGAEEFYYSENLIKADADAKHGFSFPKSGTSFSVMLDVTGKIAAVNLEGFSEYTYGYLVKTVFDKDTDPNEVYLKIFTGGGKIDTYACREKFRLDGKSGKREALGKTLEGVPQLIAFKTDADGRITEVDTGEFDYAYENEETSLSLDKVYDGIIYKTIPKIFYEKGTYETPRFYINGATRIFKVPSKSNILNKNYTEKDFEIVADSYLREYVPYSIEIFNMSETRCPEILVVYEDTGTSLAPTTSARRIMVDKIGERLNSDNEVEFYLNGYYFSAPVSYTFRDEKLLNDFIDGNGNITIKRGDIVSANVSANNEIYAFGMYREFNDEIENKQTAGDGIESGRQMAMGYAYAKDSGVIVLRIDADILGIEEDIYSVYPGALTRKVTLYDATTDSVSLITVADVLCETEAGEGAYLLSVRVSADGSGQEYFAYKLR